MFGGGWMITNGCSAGRRASPCRRARRRRPRASARRSPARSRPGRRPRQLAVVRSPLMPPENRNDPLVQRTNGVVVPPAGSASGRSLIAPAGSGLLSRAIGRRPHGSRVTFTSRVPARLAPSRARSWARSGATPLGPRREGGSVAPGQRGGTLAIRPGVCTFRWCRSATCPPLPSDPGDLADCSHRRRRSSSRPPGLRRGDGRFSFSPSSLDGAARASSRASPTGSPRPPRVAARPRNPCATRIACSAARSSDSPVEQPRRAGPWTPGPRRRRCARRAARASC